MALYGTEGGVIAGGPRLGQHLINTLCRQYPVSLYLAYYNWCWRSRENDGPKCGRFRLTPAMQAGLTDKLWKIGDLYDAVMAA